MTVTTPELLECRQASRQRLTQAQLLTGLGLLKFSAIQWLPSSTLILSGWHIEGHWLFLLLTVLLLVLGLLAWGSYLVYRLRCIG